MEHGGANLPDVFARLDNFMVEALQEAPMPSLSLTDNDGNPITSGIEAEPGTPFMLCLSPDSAPAENMDLELSIDGDGSPHFSDFTTTPLTFLAGTADSICFELSPASDTTTGTYTFKFEHGNDIVMDFQVVVELCSVAGPDQTICGGESVQLGTGNLTEPSGVDYCYVWEPSTGLDNPGSSMPNASPLETTTYTVYVTSSEGDVICVDEVTVFVNQIEIQNGTIPEICAGEMVTISVNPIGQGPFSYTWETGENTASIDVSPEFGKSYLVAITDESTACTLVKEVKVNVYLPPNVEITSVYPSICVPTQPPGLQPGQGTGTRAPSNSNSEECVNAKTTMYVSPSYPSYDIQWSTGATDFSIEADEPREYSVTVTNSIGCSDIESYELGSCADVTLTPSLNSSGEGILDAGAGFTSYEWHDGSTEQTILVDGPGLYAVTVSNESGCSGQAEEFIDTYSYNPDEVYLVYATYVQQPSEAAKVHIYICTTGSEDEVTKSLILQEVRQEFNNLDPKPEKYVFAEGGCQVVNSYNFPVRKNASNKIMPFVIKNGSINRVFFDTSTSMYKNYQFRLIIDNGDAHTLDQQSSGNDHFNTIFFENLAQEIEMSLTIGEIVDGQIEYDPDPAIEEMRITFAEEVPVAEPEETNYNLYVNGQSIDEGGTVEVERGEVVTLVVWNETTEEIIQENISLYTNFQWWENGFGIGSGDEKNIGTNSFNDNEERTVKVRFTDILQNKTIELNAIVKALAPTAIIGFTYPTDPEDVENRIPCTGAPIGSPCAKNPSYYVERAMDILRDHPNYTDIIATLETEYAVRINFNRASNTNSNLGCGRSPNEVFLGAEYGHNDPPPFKGALNRIFLSDDIRKWGEVGNPLDNSLDDCPKEAELLILISDQERDDIIQDIDDGLGNGQINTVVSKISEVNNELAIKINEWINYSTIDGHSQSLEDEAISMLNDMFENTKDLAYKIDDYDGSIDEILSVSDAASDGVLHINLNVDMLDYIPYYGRMLDLDRNVSIWYRDNPSCGIDGGPISTVDEARLRKYTQTIAHEIRHLDFSINENTVESYKWKLIRASDPENDMYRRCSPAIKNIVTTAYSTHGIGHEHGNPDGEHACQAESDFADPTNIQDF
ncbi:MAG: hypothetical protein NXI08_16375 [bacterium]|nr:hypothetical protein [bacterium]